MDNISQSYLNLGFNITNGQALDIIKMHYQFYAKKYDDLRSDDQTTLAQLREAFNDKQAYDILIENFEKYLNHDR